MFPKRMKAIDILEKNWYLVGWADAPPRAWTKSKFYFAIGTKDEEKLGRLGFKIKEADIQAEENLPNLP
jgi:hypothetical protein